MIQNGEPPDWQALEHEVGRVLAECGFAVEVGAKVKTARGGAELDVLAVGNFDGRRSTTICECKWWNSNIPQTVVHAFRGVVSDFGADIGYIVARQGFQTGAIEAAKNTNIRLVTWQGLQEEFEQAWLKNYFVPEMTRSLDEFLEITEPLPPNFVHYALQRLSKVDRDAFIDLRNRYFPIAILLAQFTAPWVEGLRRPLHHLPLRDTLAQEIDRSWIPTEILDATAYRELCAVAVDLSSQATSAMKRALGLS